MSRWFYPPKVFILNYKNTNAAPRGLCSYHLGSSFIHSKKTSCEGFIPSPNHSSLLLLFVLLLFYLQNKYWQLLSLVMNFAIFSAVRQLSSRLKLRTGCLFSLFCLPLHNPSSFQVDFLSSVKRRPVLLIVVFGCVHSAYA